MFLCCICTQYLVVAPFALITASIRRGMEVISLWHCWGGMEAQVSLTVAFSSSAFFGLFLIFLLTIPHRFSMGFRSGEFAGQSSTPTLWSFNQLLAVWPGAKSQNVLVNGCSDVGFQKTQWTNTSRWHCTPNHHRLWKLNTGLQATWAMSFSTLPPDSRTLASKWNTKLSQHSVNSQLLWQWMFVAYPPCEGCQWLSSGWLSDQQSSPWLCSLVNQTERPFWRLRKRLQVFWVD